jgi:acetyltransferase-like isoleucine patch superfamily enzyme
MSNSTPATRLGEWLANVRSCPSILWRLEARLKGVTFQGTSEFLGRPLISVAPGTKIVIGAGFHCYSAVRTNPLGCFQPCVLRTLAAGAELQIGPNAGMSGTVICAASSIRIGEGTIFGSGALVMDNDFHVPAGEWGWNDGPQVYGRIAKPIVIGRGVFIGARAIILKGVTIGDRAVVGAGAVVSKDVPPRYTVVGNPGRLIAPNQTASEP